MVCFSHVDYDRSFTDFDLLTLLKIGELQFRNRIVVSLICQSSSQGSLANDWQLVYLGSRAAGGAGSVFIEATAVTAQRRISPYENRIKKRISFYFS